MVDAGYLRPLPRKDPANKYATSVVKKKQDVEIDEAFSAFRELYRNRSSCTITYTCAAQASFNAPRGDVCPRAKQIPAREKGFTRVRTISRVINVAGRASSASIYIM